MVYLKANMPRDEMKKTVTKWYEEIFKKEFEQYTQENSRQVSEQLITLVSIFTALAFLIFGSISSLDNLFQSNTTLLKVLCSTVAWGLWVINLVFVFLYCVSRITRLEIGSKERSKLYGGEKENGSLLQQFPFVWWVNSILLFLLAVLGWFYLMRKNTHLEEWFTHLNTAQSVGVTAGGAVAIIVIFGLFWWKLWRSNRGPWKGSRISDKDHNNTVTPS